MSSLNFQKEFEKICEKSREEGKRYKLLLHSCCAPCSSYCLVILREFFDITCLYYNPNITDEDEYYLRVKELHRLATTLNEDPIYVSYSDNGKTTIELAGNDYLDRVGKINVIEDSYSPNAFFDRVKNGNLEGEPEGGSRCHMCFDLRLTKARLVAQEINADYFTTSLTISPLKNANVLNEIGFRLASDDMGGPLWLPSDFKKKNGYLMSVELCKRYDMYRQNYCGCVYSMKG